MPYNCQLIYQPGRDSENPANFLSRHPSFTSPEEPHLVEVYVNYVSINAVQKQRRLKISNKELNTA